MAQLNELNFGGGRLFGCMKVLEKFQLIWIYQNGTSFTELSAGQKLEKIAVDKWMDELS
jgi:hypothetical protein